MLNNILSQAQARLNLALHRTPELPKKGLAIAPYLKEAVCSGACVREEWFRGKDRCPFRKIKHCNYGQISWRIDPAYQKSCPPLVGEEGRPYLIEDFCKHVEIMAGPGSGKSRRILRQILRELLSSTHLPPGPDRDRLIPGLVFFDGKGEFARLGWKIAQRYARAEYCVFFGPSQPWSIDPFGDPSMTVFQKAQIGKTLMEAIRGKSGGGGSADFFADSAMILMQYLFMLHEALREHDPKKYPPMSYTVMSFLISDRGKARNQDVLEGEAALIKGDSTAYAQALKALLAGAESLYTATSRFLRSDLERVQSGRRPTPLVTEFSEMSYENEFSKKVQNLVQVLQRWTTLQLSSEEGKKIPVIISEAYDPALQLLTLLGDADLVPTLDAWRVEATEFIQQADQTSLCFLTALGRKKNLTAPEYGLLRQWVTDYKDLLKRKGGSEMDRVTEYFDGEYLNISNQETTGSVGMTARTMVELLSLPPFDKLFCPNPTFDLKKIITEGKLFFFDMDFALYQDAAKVASVLVKQLIFRLMLSRVRLGLGSERIVPTIIDEFATVATQGLWAGEGSYMDKSRGLNGPMIMAYQNRPMLKMVYPEDEVQKVAGLSQTKFYGRNSDKESITVSSESSSIYYRGEMTLEKDASQSMLSSDTTPGRDHRVSYRKENRIEPAEFIEFEPGEFLTVLPPEFKSKMYRRVILADEGMEEFAGALPFPNEDSGG